MSTALEFDWACTPNGYPPWPATLRMLITLEDVRGYQYDVFTRDVDHRWHSLNWLPPLRTDMYIIIIRIAGSVGPSILAGVRGRGLAVDMIELRTGNT